MTMRRQWISAVQALTVVAAAVSVLASDGPIATLQHHPRQQSGVAVPSLTDRRAARRLLPDSSSVSHQLLTVPRGGGTTDNGWNRPRRRMSSRSMLSSPAEAMSRLVRSVIGGRNSGESPVQDDESRRNRPGSGSRQAMLSDLNVENFLRIDFSGDLDCHILGPSHHHPQFESTSSSSSSSSILPSSYGSGLGGGSRGPAPRRSSTAALIRSRHPWIPNWIVGIRYDFAKCWYGATRAWSHAQCRLFPPPFVGADSPLTAIVLRPRALLPVAVDWTTDRSLRDGDDRTNEVALYWKRSVQDRMSTSLRGRVESASPETSTPAKTTLTLQVPLHRRLSYECRIVSDAIPTFLRRWSRLLSPSSDPNDTDDSYDSDSSRNRGFRLPDVTRLDDEGWWLPDVTLRASGHLESRNAAVLPHPTRLYDGRVAVRFTIRRNLLWNRMGADDYGDYETGMDDGDGGAGPTLVSSLGSPLTTIGVEIHDIQSHAMNGIVLQTELERPLHAFRMAFVQQLYRPP